MHKHMAGVVLGLVGVLAWAPLALAAETKLREAQQDSVTSAYIVDGTIVDADINANAAIADTKLGAISTAGKVSGAALTGLNLIPAGAGVIPSANIPAGTGSSIESSEITDDTIMNADINSAAAIAGTKISPNFGSQTLVTTGSVGIGTTGPNSTLHVSGSMALPTTTKTAAYTAAAGDYTILCNATTAAFTVTLPAAAGIAGRVYLIKKIDSSANAVTIDANASETVDGALTKALNQQYASFTIQSDGTNWTIVDGHYATYAP